MTTPTKKETSLQQVSTTPMVTPDAFQVFGHGDLLREEPNYSSGEGDLTHFPSTTRGPFVLNACYSSAASISLLDELALRLDENGELDLERLERSATLASMQEWIRNRLQGKDPYVPINRQDGEPPAELFIRLALGMEPNRRLFMLLHFAVAMLLAEAWIQHPPWTSGVLELARVLRRKEYFPILMNAVLDRRRYTDEQPQIGLDREWLEAAASYPPPNALTEEWQRILDKQIDPIHAAIAYRALAYDLEWAIHYLPALYNCLRAEEREVLVEHAIFQAFKKAPSADAFSTVVRRHETQLQRYPGMVPIIVRCLDQLGFGETLALAIEKQAQQAQQAQQPSKQRSNARLQGMASRPVPRAKVAV